MSCSKDEGLRVLVAGCSMEDSLRVLEGGLFNGGR